MGVPTAIGPPPAMTITTNRRVNDFGAWYQNGFSDCPTARTAGRSPDCPVAGGTVTPERYDFSRNRWTFPVWVFGNASRNFTERGYL